MSETLLNAAYSTSVSGLHAAGTAMQAMKQALEALENGGRIETNEAITALRLAIEQAEKQAALDRMAENARELGLDYEPVQEPVALETVYETIIQWDEGGGKRSRRELARRIVALYTTPPRREWVGLTQQDIDIAFDDTQEGGGFDDFARAIAAKLREKNA